MNATARHYLGRHFLGERKINMALKGTEENATVRVLLILWDLEAHKTEAGKGDLNRCIVRTGEKASDYQPILSFLQEKNAIVIEKEKITLTSSGISTLTVGLKDESFAFDGQQIGSRFGNALLKWIRLSPQSSVIESEVETKAEPHVEAEVEVEVETESEVEAA
jgi:hypothetical protein